MLEFDQSTDEIAGCNETLNYDVDCQTLVKLEQTLRYIIIGFLTYQLLVEIFQMYKKSLKNYFRDQSNFIDLFSIGMNFFYIIMVTLGEDQPLNMYALRVIASLGNVALWAQMFFWFSLFDATAQWVNLIKDTVKDIIHFILVLLMIISMFATAAHLI